MSLSTPTLRLISSQHRLRSYFSILCDISTTPPLQKGESPSLLLLAKFGRNQRIGLNHTVAFLWYEFAFIIIIRHKGILRIMTCLRRRGRRLGSVFSLMIEVGRVGRCGHGAARRGPVPPPLYRVEEDKGLGETLNDTQGEERCLVCDKRQRCSPYNSVTMLQTFPFSRERHKSTGETLERHGLRQCQHSCRILGIPHSLF